LARERGPPGASEMTMGWPLVVVQVLLVAAIVVGLFEARARFGPGLLYAFVGALQLVQASLATAFVTLPPGLEVSVGTVVFPATLFAILLLYVVAGMSETRALVAGVVVCNLALVFLSVLFDTSLTGNVSFPHLSSRLSLVGTATLVFDCLLVIALYERL